MPIAEAIGLGAAVDYLEALGMDAVPRARAAAHRVHARARSHDRFGDRLTVYGPDRRSTMRGGIISFLFDGIHAHDISQVARRGRRVRARGPPLRQAADARPRRPRHHPRVVLRLQRRSRRRRARRRARRGPRSSSPSRAARRRHRCPASKTSTARSSSTTTARRGTAASSRCRPRTRPRGSTRCAATRWCSTSTSTATPSPT